VKLTTHLHLVLRLKNAWSYTTGKTSLFFYPPYVEAISICNVRMSCDMVTGINIIWLSTENKERHFLALY
jgi:hypothetical protein